MQTTVLHVQVDSPDVESIDYAASILRAGGLVAFPTETVYGLGANALDATAVAQLFAVKGRPPSNPVIVHVASVDDVGEVTAAWPAAAGRLAARFWPGPLTLVLPRRSRVPDIVTGGGPTVAVRLPAHPVAQALIRAADTPLAAPSANRSTHLSPTRAAHVLQELGGQIDLVLDAGPTSGGLESTVLDLTNKPARLLRPGLITPTEIEAVIGPIARPVLVRETGQAPLPSPGLMRRHYAPRAALECAPDGGRARVEQLAAAGVRVGWLTFTVPAGPWISRAEVVVMPDDPVRYAARLYAALHDLDDAGVERIVVGLPADNDDWMAIRDRLRRASAAP
jgi:L-threonylcarbamoyladenylate synthase